MHLSSSARHARVRSGRVWRRSSRGPATTATAAAIALLASVISGPAAAAPAVTDPCGGAYAPVLRDVSVSQGVGAQTPLVRGKSTVVRLFLSSPDCAPAGTVQLVSARLRAFEGTTALTDDVPTTPGALGPTYPAFEALDLPLAPESPANPVFVLPGFGSTSSTSGEFGATFRATVTYQYRPTPDRVETATQVYERVSETGEPIATAVGPRTNALRVLLVPMGDGNGTTGAPPASQFPMAANGGTPVNGQYADQTVQRGMATLSRLMPLPDGTGDLTSTDGGLRYRLDLSGMLDLSRLVNRDGSAVLRNGVFCGNSYNSIPVYSELSSYLASWNKNNSKAQADVVVGVVWQGVSGGGAAGCAEGFANLMGNQAWVRTFADRTAPDGILDARSAGASMTGPLLGMEISHTFGSVPRTDDGRYNLTHSKNYAADPSHALATVDSRVGKFLAGPLSVMRYSGSSAGYTDPAAEPNPWNNESALFEVEDYRYNQCVLTPGMTSAQCPFNGSLIGSVGSSAATGAFVLSGTVEGIEADGLFASYSGDELEVTPPDESSEYVLVQRGGAGQVLPGPLGVQRVPVRFTSSVHDADNAHVTQQVGAISAAMQAAPGVAHIELWRGEPGGLCTATDRPTGCLYARSAGAAPTVTATSGSSRLLQPQSFSNASGDETSAAVSPDGRTVAWAAGTPGGGSSRLVLQARDAEAGSPSGPPAATGVAGHDPAWSRDGSSLVFANADGDLLLADVLDADGDGRLDRLANVRTVYRRALQVPPPVGSAAAHSPSFSPAGDALVAEINGGVWRMDARERTSVEQVQCDLATFRPSPTCEVLVRAGTSPSWRWPAAAGSPALVAYQAQDGIRTLDPAVRPSLTTADYASVLRLPGGREPAWGGNLLAYTDGRGLLVADARDQAADGTWFSTARLTTEEADARPWLTPDDKVLGFDRPSGGSGRDVLVGERSDDARTLRFEASTTDDPSLLRADVLIGCGNGFDPAAVNLLPTVTSEGKGTFEVPFTDAGACPGGTVYARVNNGYETSALTPVRRIPTDRPVAPPVAPSPAIGSPAPGTAFLQYDAVVATGSSILPVGTNPADVQGAWRLTGPSGSGLADALVGTDPTMLRLDPPVPGGWTTGRYSLTLSVTAGGLTGTSSTHFFVLPDPAHAGRSVQVGFEPQTLYVPSSGNDVTVTVTSAHVDLSGIDPSSLRVVEVGNHPIDLAARGWSPNKDGSYTVKFDRQQLICELLEAGLSSGYARIVLSGAGPGIRIRGLDQQYPILTPSSFASTC